MKSILIAHKDRQAARFLENALIKRGFGAVHFSDGDDALEYQFKNPADILFVQLELPQTSGIDVLKKTREINPEARVVLMSRDDSARTASEAMRNGACDVLIEPVQPHDMESCLARLFDSQAEEKPPAGPGPAGKYGRIIGESSAIKSVFRLVDKVAKSDSTVMIYGESGTGKELIARAIHQNSRRHDKPLIPVNCGAIPEELLESELFGHEKGAFTSAIRTRIGRFEMADGGTIFLDEVADMSPKLQVKILRVLQEHEFERIGGAKTVGVDIRVITATNKNLQQAVEQGRFREDLYYRLNVIPVNLPPLRDRRGDIPLLVDHFINRFRETKGVDIKGVHPDVLAKIVSYSWPGNIRELENIIERMIILAESDVLTVEDLPQRISEIPNSPLPAVAPVEIGDDGIDFNQVVSDFENQLLLKALEKSDWVKNKAAQLLKLNRTTLVEKLKKKNINGPDI